MRLVLPDVCCRAGFTKVKAIKRGRKNHGMALEQVTDECCVSVFCLGVKVTNMNRSNGSHPGIGVDKIHNGNIVPVAQAFLEMGPPTAADFNRRVGVRRMRHQDVEGETNGRNTKEDPIALVGIEIDDFYLFPSENN